MSRKYITTPSGFSHPEFIPPIETHYSGYRFRSRLEARWAVYFDFLNIKWEYEVEGYDLIQAPVPDASELGSYLPDFWFPRIKMWAEVKPCEFSGIEIRKCDALARLTGYPCLMLDGLPELKNYWAKCPDGYENDYLLDDTYLDENRFYGCTGYGHGELHREIAGMIGRNAQRAIDAAKAARFEYGENPFLGATKQ